MCYTYSIYNINISGFTLRILPMSAVRCGYSVLPIDIRYRYQVSGVRYCSYSHYLDYCQFSRLSAIMRVKYASCSRSNLGVYSRFLSSAMPYVPLLLVLRPGQHSSRCSNGPQQQRCLLLRLLQLLLLFLLLCRCCYRYRFHVRERPSLLHKRRWE